VQALTAPEQTLNLPPLVTGEDIQRVLRCGRKKLLTMVKGGKFPAPVRVGNHLRWHREQVEQYLASLAPVEMGASYA
jgi:excisionase family DNA binding protein